MKKLETKKTQKTKKTGYNIFKTIILSTVIGLSIAATFLHEYQVISSKESVAIKKEYKSIISERNKLLDNILVGLEKGTLNSSEYIFAYNNIRTTTNASIKDYKSRKKAIKNNDSYLGYSSFKNFLLGIGFPICGFFMSILFLSIVVQNIQNSFKKKYYIIVSFAFIASWGYWLAWSLLDFAFDPKRGYDWGREYYNFALYVLPTVMFIASYFIFTYFETLENKFRSAIKNMFQYIFESSKDLKEDTIEDHEIKRGKLIRETIDNVK